MTVDDAERIFTRGTLKFNNTIVFLNGMGKYHLTKDEEPISGTYEFLSQSGKVFLRTTPPIIIDKRDLEITICLENLPVTLMTES